MTTAESKPSQLIHVGKIGQRYLFLRKTTPQHYLWFSQESDGNETPTELSALDAQEALRLANRQWRQEEFCTLNCGYRYTLPERDEHGTKCQ